MSETFGARITRYAIEMVPCPTCKADPGHRCYSRKTGTTYPPHGQHISRWRAAKAELVEADSRGSRVDSENGLRSV